MGISKRRKPLLETLENLDKERFVQSEKENDDRRKKIIMDKERQNRNNALWPSEVTQKIINRGTDKCDPEIEL